jgi:vacuolar-type H+-ATPase subunit E/Vma4
MFGDRKFVVILSVVFLIGLSSCSTVPKEAVELSNTVGRDLEEMHRSHRALAELHFGQLISEINVFVDGTYRPAFIAKFADEFELGDKVAMILREDPEKLLPMMTRFMTIATERVEKKRSQLLEPIEAQRREVLTNIDMAYRQIQSAQSIVTAHLASVSKVHEAQGEILTEVGLGDVREQIAAKTSEVSDAVKNIVNKGKDIDSGMDKAKDKIEKLDAVIAEARDKLSKLRD